MELTSTKQKLIALAAGLAIVLAVAVIIANFPRDPKTLKDAGIGRPAKAGGGVEDEGAGSPFGPGGEPATPTSPISPN
jgi:hypothetical protein